MEKRNFQESPERQGPEVFKWVFSVLGVHGISDIISTNKPLVFFLKGPLGSGKTEFVKSAFSFLGGESTQIQSPTFLKVIEHEILDVGRVIHADFYRVESASEFEKIGFLESIASVILFTIQF